MPRLTISAVRVAALQAALILGCLGVAQVASAQPDSAHEVECGDLKEVVAELRGKVSFLRGIEPVAQIAVFNGHELLTSRAHADGSYCVPLVRSTDDTFVSVFATAPMAVPQVRNVRVSLKGYEGRPSHIEVPPFELVRSPNPDFGYIIGVAYIRVTSGRPVAREGIIVYDANLEISIEGARQTKFKTDVDGVYLTPMPPGGYRVTSRRNVVIDDVTVRSGVTSIQPLFSGERILF